MKKLLIVILTALIGCITGITAALAVDADAPVPANVTITSPVHGGFVGGQLQVVRALAQEPVKTAYLFIDGILKGETNLLGESTEVEVNIPVAWDSRGYANLSKHKIYMVCFTMAGDIAIGRSEVIVDNEPPVTTATLEGTKKNESGWFASDVSVSMAATDYPNPGGSGVVSTVYGIGSSSLMTYSTPFFITDEGITDLVYKSTDKAGNEESLKHLEVKIDKTNPVVSITSPSNGSFAEPGSIVKITGHATDNVDIKKVEFYNGTTLLGEGNNEGAGNYIFNWPAVDGIHNITAKAYDTAGNETVSNPVKIKVLKLTITSPANNSAVSGMVSTFTATANVPVKKAELYIDNETVPRITLDNLNTTNINIAYNWNTLQLPEDSQHNIKIACYTVAEMVYFSGAVTVKVDNDTAPWVNIYQPYETIVGPSGGWVDFRIDAYDSTGVTGVQLFCDGNLLGWAEYKSELWVDCEGARTIYYWYYRWQALVGNHTFMAKAYDSSGQVGISEPKTVTVPTVVTVNSPVYESTVSGVVNTFTATTRDPVVKAELFIDGVLKASSDYPGGTTSVSISYNWDTDQYNANGEHHVTIKCYTLNGEVVSLGYSRVWVICVTLTNPSPGSTVSGTLTNFTATTREPVSRADLYIDGVKYASAENINSTNVSIAYNWDTTQYDDNNYEIEIRGYTVTGNKELSGKFRVSVDNIPDSGG